MGTDGCEEDGGNVRVDERAAGGEGVGCAAGGGREDDAVGGDTGEEGVVGVEVEGADVGGRAAVDDEFVEDFVGFALDFRVLLRCCGG